jgi:F0F1-type ATP synthase membrane subunit b/b'
MNGGERTALDSRAIQTKVRELRGASFKESRKGFDRDEVMTYLHRLAAWLEGAGLADPEEVRRELAMVGQRTSEILTKAEEAANDLRAEAQRNAGQIVDSARAEAERIRADAKADVRRAQDDADARAEEVVDEADRRAERMIDEAVKRRQSLEVVIDDLVAARDEILADTRRLIDELSELVARTAGEEAEEAEQPQEAGEEGGADTAELSEGEEGEADVDEEPDFALRDRVQKGRDEGEREELEPDTGEHSRERASRGAS